MIPLEVRLACEPFILDNFNPVAVRIQYEGDILHPPVGQSLLPVDVQALQPLAGRIELVDGHTCTLLAEAEIIEGEKKTNDEELRKKN